MSTPDATNARTPSMATVVITADHVYLPLDENGDGTFDWAVSNVLTTKVAAPQPASRCPSTSPVS